MDEIKVTVEKVEIGKYDCDCMYTTIDKIPIQICFNKDDKIAQYNGKEITLVKKDGVYSIQVDTSKK
jgi:hypothetical protein